MPSIQEMFKEEYLRATDSGPTYDGAWGMHQKALDSEQGRWKGIVNKARAEFALRQGVKDAGDAGSTSQSPYYTGPASLFGVLGAERDILSTRIQPVGLASALPAKPSNAMIPYFEYLTGFLDSTGTEPVAECDDPVTAGSAKTCIQTAQFGIVKRQSRPINLLRLGETINRGEFMDSRLINDPLLGPGAGGLTTPTGIAGGFNPAQEALMRQLEIGVAFQNKLSPMVFQGNPANNAGHDPLAYAEFPGLDILIGTGKIDAFTSALCPSMDSILMDFNYGRIDANGQNIVAEVAYMAYNLRFNAERMGFNPATWVIAMRSAAFYELSAVWPCAYLTYRCNLSGGATSDTQARDNVSATDQIAMRDAMRAGRYLLIDGEKWPVVFDDGIFEDTSTANGSLASGCFSSDIYFIPITVSGGFDATYFEYRDWRGTNPAAAFPAMSALGNGNFVNTFFWSDDGRYFWINKTPVNTCVQWEGVVSPRIVLRTPFLAGRVQHVAYCPLLHTREPFNADPYFKNGGVSLGRSTIATLTPAAEWGTHN